MKSTDIAGRIGNSFIVVLIGAILFVFSCFALWWNEDNFVRNYEIARFITHNVVNADINSISGLNEGKLVHLSGYASSSDTINDEFIKLTDIIALQRKVAMYQWKEIRINNNETSPSKPQYKYITGWDKNLIDSTAFEIPYNHENPKVFPIQSKRIDAKNVKYGDFILSKEQISKINPSIKITQLPNIENYKILNGFYFTGLDYDNPAIGDLKISYYYIPDYTPVSVIAMQKGNSLVPYKLKHGEINLISEGKLSSHEMLKQFKSFYLTSTTIYRIATIALIILSMNFIIKPIVIAFDDLPIFDTISSYVSTFAILMISAALSLFIISSVWMTYFPAVGFPMFMAGVFILIFLPRKKHIRIE